MKSEAQLFYESNQDFQKYVNRYCITYHVTTEVALQHRLVLNVMQYYKDLPKSEQK